MDAPRRFQFGIRHILWLPLIAAVCFKVYADRLEKRRLLLIRVKATLDSLEPLPDVPDVRIGFPTEAEWYKSIGESRDIERGMKADEMEYHRRLSESSPLGKAPPRND